MKFSEVFIDACKTDEYYDALHKLWRNKDWLEDDPFIKVLGRDEREQKEVEYYIGLDMLFTQLSKTIYKFLHKYHLLFDGCYNARDIRSFEDYIKKNLFKDLSDFCKEDFKEFPVHDVLERHNERLLRVVRKFHYDFYNEQLEYIIENIVQDDVIFGRTSNHDSKLEGLMESFHDFVQDELTDDLLAGKKDLWVSEKTREKYIMGIKTRVDKNGSFWVSPQLILDSLDLEKLKEE